MKTKLFSPMTIRNVTLINRLVMSPMCMYSSSKKEGMVEDFHLVHYAARAYGQTGLIIVEATAVEPQGRISVYDLGIWDDRHLDGLSRLTERIHEGGAKAGIQLAHAGRKARVDGECFAPSAIPYKENTKIPKEMTKEEIQNTVEAFRLGALRAKKAGFDVIELHAAHGYLINEFLSPLTNQRTDEYGGQAENRFRFLREIITSVREVWDGPLFVRISASEYNEKGLTVADYLPYVKEMKMLGVDLIDVSSGGVVSARINVYPGYQIPFSEKIRQEAQIPTGAVGLITSPFQAAEIIDNKRADLVFIGRELLRDPYFAIRAAKALGAEISIPKQYDKAWL